MSRRTLNGNLIYNGDLAIVPTFTAATTTANKWIDGTAAGSSALKAQGWSIVSGALTATASAQFDTSVTYLGSNSLKLATGDATGVITCGTYLGTAPSLSTAFLLDPNTSYTLTFRVKTSNVATNAVFVDLRQYTNALSSITTTSSTKFSGTNDWTEVTLTVTTQPTCAFGALLARNNVAGNVGAAWFAKFKLTKTAAVTRTTA